MPHPKRPQFSPYKWTIVTLGFVILGVLGYRFLLQHDDAVIASKLPKFYTVPPFILTERSGKTVTNMDLDGKIWVADFIFTTCPGPCPLVTANMAKLQTSLAHDPRVQLVTFTVDPQNDTQAVLAAYADKFGADPNRWWFLTGPQKSVYDLIQDGFKLVVQDNHGQPLQDGEYVVTHSTQLVLIDGDGYVRAYSDGVGADGRAEMLHNIKTLEQEEAP